MATRTPRRRKSNSIVGFARLKNIDDVDIVLNFLKVLPGTLISIFDSKWFRAHLENYSRKYDFDQMLFFEAFDEARIVLENNIAIIEKTIELDPAEKEVFRVALKKIGFTGSSLQLKAAIINYDLKELKTGLNNFRKKVKNPFIKIFRKAVKGLNNAMGSLKGVIPGVEALKEVKDISEAVVDVAENITDEGEKEGKPIQVVSIQPRRRAKPVTTKTKKSRGEEDNGDLDI